MARTKNKRKTSIGVLFWIAFIMFLLVVFLFSRSQIQQVLNTTGLVQVIKDKFSGKSVTEAPLNPDGSTPAPATGAPAPGGTANRTVTSPQVVVTTAPGATGRSTGTVSTTSSNPKSQTTQTSSNGTPASTKSTSGTSTQSRDSTSSSSSGTATGATSSAASTSATSSTGTAAEPATGTAATTDTQSAYRTRLSTIYFTRVTGDGRIIPEAVVREVRYVDSPLTQTIQALLKGPTAEELNKGLLNLIPEKTRLLSAEVQNGIAYLNFNDAFGINPMGVEGFLAELKQIVHTATEFSTVSRVQFLVNGKKLDYLGGEGIYIGRPLSRDSFS